MDGRELGPVFPDDHRLDLIRALTLSRLVSNIIYKMQAIGGYREFYILRALSLLYAL